MRTLLAFVLTMLAVASAPVPPARAEAPPAGAQDSEEPAGAGAEQPGPGESNIPASGALSSDPVDPANQLPEIRARREQKDALLPKSPLHWAHEYSGRGKQFLYDAIGLDLGIAYTQAFQVVTESLPGADNWGTASDVDFLATLELVHRGKPTQGQIFAHVEGRWNWGTTGPETLGTEALGSVTGTGNTFAEYEPTFLPFRNLYWQQGSKEAGWAYRIGKITPDAMLATSAHIAAPLTFMSTAGAGSFAMAHADSGLGIAAVWYPHPRVRLLGLFSDANANRQDWGDIGEGDFYKAVELGVQIAPRTERAGYSKLTFWHTDGTDDGEPANGNLGPDGWGFFIKLEQELTADGRAVGVVKYGTSFEDSAAYKHLAGAFLLYYDPNLFGLVPNDLVGIAFNYGDVTPPARNEYNLEIFYRFPIFPLVDVTLTYHSIWNPGLDPDNDQANAFSLRLRTTF
jgi:hypothetical protein